MRNVLVMVSAHELAESLARWVGSRVDGASVQRVLPSAVLDGCREVVLTTEADCSTFRCADLAHKGATVIVLAAVPKSSSGLQYRAAGAAAYLAMSLDSFELEQTIRLGVGGHSPGASPE